MTARILWSARSRNAKTGDVPTAWVGDTIEAARKTCAGCPLLDRGCYAWSGSPRTAFAAIRKARVARTLERAIKGRARSARMIRLTAIGDIGGHGPGTRDAIVSAASAAKLAIIGYTHRWRDTATRDVWGRVLMASADTLDDADRAVRDGWRAAVVVPVNTPRTFETPEGRKGIVCPAQVSEGGVTCNTCRLCDASKPGLIIGFREHGPKNQTPADYRKRATSAG